MGFFSYLKGRKEGQGFTLPTANATSGFEQTAEISNEEFSQSRRIFGLARFQATSLSSPAFRAAVRRFQKCKGQIASGVLSPEQMAAALAEKDVCLEDARSPSSNGEAPVKPPPPASSGADAQPNPPSAPPNP